MIFMAVLKLITTLAMFYTIESTCGPPGDPMGAYAFGRTSTAHEGQTISYQCKQEFKQVYGSVRRCVRGKWTPKIPKCAVKESIRLKVENYKVNYIDFKNSEDFSTNKSFEYLEFIKLNWSQRFNFEIQYRPKSRISYVELDLQILSDDFSLNLKVNLFINDYRNCVTSSQRLSEFNSVIEFKFICEAKSDFDYEIEGKDKPNSLRFSFDSQNKFRSRIIRISVFRFQSGCGSPDLPLNTRSIVDSGNTVSIYASKPDRYRIWGADYESVNCMFEGNWDKDFQPLHPIRTCSIKHFDWDSLHYKNLSFEYFEYFNDTLLAAVDSKIQFQCNNSQESTEYHYLYCQEDGNWTNDFDICEEHGGKNETNSDKESSDESNFLVIIVTLISTFLTTLTLVFIFGSIYILQRKRKKNRKKDIKELSVKYNRELSSSSNHYESVDYQTINLMADSEDISHNNHIYMQLYD